MQRTTLGLDIGGANLKASKANGDARSVSFALWKHPDRLTHHLGQLVATFPPVDALAVTMTGELCDCFRTKRDGVRQILDGVLAVAKGRPVQVFGTDGHFHTPEAVIENPLVVAAANWLALATYCGRLVPSGPALLIDIGSTTTDIIPLTNGRPTPQGRTDSARLQSGELVYSGVRRTPMCALLPAGRVAAELFATTQDLWLVAGEVADDATDGDTADGRPATREYARERIARMVGGDSETITDAELVALVTEGITRQTALIRQAIADQGTIATAIISGSGEFLARRVLAQMASALPPISLTEQLGSAVATAAPAYAVAVLATEQSA